MVFGDPLRVGDWVITKGDETAGLPTFPGLW